MSTSIVSRATEAAEAVREEHWGDSIPVDPAKIAAKLGIEVLDAFLDADVAGAIQRPKSGQTRIYLSANDHPNRKRFTCAHEIGHFMKHGSDADRFEYVDYRDGTAEQGKDTEERFANAFAAALLMPEERVKEEWKRRPDDRELARRFGVSKAAMVNRLKNLDLYR